MAVASGDNSKHRNVPLLPRLQGITSSIDDLKLMGSKFVDQVGGAFVDGTLVRKMAGASELKLEIEDPRKVLLKSQLLAADAPAYRLELDGLGWRYVAYEKGGELEPLILTHEAEVVWRLRQFHGPHKAFRDQMTRAEFCKLRVDELKPPVPRFVCPELHVVQPVKSLRDARKQKQESKEERGHGIGDGVHLETKEGEKADQAQIQLGDMALRIGENLQAPIDVLVALIAALIDETVMGKLARGNVLQAEGEPAGAPIGDAVQEITGFLTGAHWTIPGGAIGYANHHPTAGPAEIATNVQGNAAGAGPYEQVVPAARKWVAAFGGSGGSLTELQPQRYPFEEKAKEDHWKCITRLGGQVNWRVFESAGWVYFIAEPTLLDSHQRMVIGDSTPGVLDTTIKGDQGKEKDEVTIEAMTNAWAAPPGSAVVLEDHGPADGTYLVEQIESPLRKRIVPAQITLKRPTKPKKEPAPPTKSRSVSFGSGAKDESAPADAPPAIGKMIAEVDATDNTFHYQWGGGHESVDALHKRLKGYDCSGYVSHVLWAGGLLDEPLSSIPLESFGEAGEGEFCTIYANSEHAFGKLLTADGWRYFQSGGNDNSTGWVPKGNEDSLAGFTARHPKGM